MTLPALPSNSNLAHLKWISETELGIDWNDGHTSVYSLRYLREACPCAVCKEEGVHSLGLKKGIRLRPKVPVTKNLAIVSVWPIGRYAIQIAWSDGHRAGIYSYDYLRKICPCSECKSKEKSINR
jgi:DUF971 family protein